MHFNWYTLVGLFQRQCETVFENRTLFYLYFYLVHFTWQTTRQWKAFTVYTLASGSVFPILFYFIFSSFFFIICWLLICLIGIIALLFCLNRN